MSIWGVLNPDMKRLTLEASIPVKLEPFPLYLTPLTKHLRVQPDTVDSHEWFNESAIARAPSIR
jgi:hypothetical protein